MGARRKLGRKIKAPQKTQNMTFSKACKFVNSYFFCLKFQKIFVNILKKILEI